MAGDDAHSWRQLCDGCVMISAQSEHGGTDARLVLFLRQYSLERAVVRAGGEEKAQNNNDIEKGVGSHSSITDQARVAKSNTKEDDDDMKTTEEKYSSEGDRLDYNKRPESASTGV
jgi:hypothetical protein